MKKTLSYLVFVIVMALSLGVLTGCVQKEQNEAKEVVQKEVADEKVSNPNEEKVNDSEEDVEEKETEPEEKPEPLSKVEATKVVNDKFEKALEIYELTLFDYDSSEYISIPGQDNYYFIIKNFDDITNSNFTEKGKDDLIKEQGLIYEYESEYYIALGSKAEWLSNYEITDLEIESEKITATVKVDVSVGEQELVKDKEVPFVIVLQDGNWIIDTYIDVSDVQNY